jgi:(E)-4-hydroxy-3-methylbut-2-enyl-diphosphate synthase
VDFIHRFLCLFYLLFIVYNKDMNTKFKALKPRRKSRAVMVGGIGIGGDNPVRVQTMTNTDTLDVDATVNQIIECAEAGAELVRVTAQTKKHARAIGKIKKALKKKGYNTPIIADIHFLPEAAFEALKYADKVRLNPGNLFDSPYAKKRLSKEEYEKELKRVEKNLMPFIKELKKAKKPIRVGANHGSLSGRILSKYGDTPEGMAESAMEYLRIFKKYKFNDIVVAMKASDPLIMIEANRLLVNKMEKENMDYPIHLGVTEAGSGEDGRSKSIIGIGVLLLEGIGDTIRVSLTENPVKEIPVCYSVLQATRRRITKTEFISCPSCGRTLFNIEKVTNVIKEEIGHLKGVRIAIMGCIVNGIGEMGDADFGYVGGKPGMINLYYKKKLIKRDVPEDKAIKELIRLIKEKGVWAEKN